MGNMLLSQSYSTLSLSFDSTLCYLENVAAYRYKKKKRNTIFTFLRCFLLLADISHVVVVVAVEEWKMKAFVVF